MTAWGLTLAAAVIVGAWFLFVAPATLSYLSPYLGQGLSELMRVAGGSVLAGSFSGLRCPLGGSRSPPT